MLKKTHIKKQFFVTQDEVESIDFKNKRQYNMYVINKQLYI